MFRRLHVLMALYRYSNNYFRFTTTATAATDTTTTITTTTTPKRTTTTTTTKHLQTYKTHTCMEKLAPKIAARKLSPTL